MVQIQHLNKSYKATDGGDAVPVLRDLSLEIPDGGSAAIVGPSGSGKSTLLSILGALDSADAGEITVDGRDVGKLSPSELADFRSRTVGFIFQLHHLLPQCSVLENVLIPTLARRDRDAEKDSARARELLEKVGLSHRLQHRPGELSGGERQRVAVARALINSPRLLLADEPTGALDRINAERLVDLLAELNRTEKVSLVMVTHAADLARKMERVLEIRDGALHPLSTPAS